ncbi:MAG: type II toxin-antitoxin system VapC family toxin [Candidatus Berkelbacteria bacterium]|nr:type II toxin-antitoxin system VapC family toxin [Candidatus Berkelbacteria bacterium]
MYTLDTNFVIYYLIKDKQADKFFNENLTNTFYYISVISRVELFSYPEITPEEFSSIEAFLSNTRSVLIDNEIAMIAAELRRKYKIKTPDSLVAATALYTNTSLVTRNTKDFEKIKELKVIKV